MTDEEIAALAFRRVPKTHYFGLLLDYAKGRIMHYTEEQLIERAKYYWAMYYTVRVPPENKLFVVSPNGEAYYWKYARAARIVNSSGDDLALVVHFSEGYRAFLGADTCMCTLIGGYRWYYPATVPIEGLIGHM